MFDRGRVRGRWPTRKELPTFQLLSDAVPDAVVQQCREVIKAEPNQDLENQCLDMIDGKAHPAMYQNGYRQVLMQHLDETATPSNPEMAYTKWADGTDLVSEYMADTFSNIYRTRVSSTPKGGVLGWHIDTNTSVMCRIQIGVDPNGSEFLFYRDGNVERFQMKSGELWFINTGYPHTVVNGPVFARTALIASLEYPDLEPLL